MKNFKAVGVVSVFLLSACCTVPPPDGEAVECAACETLWIRMFPPAEAPRPTMGKTGDTAPEVCRGAVWTGCLVRLFFKQCMLVPALPTYKGQIACHGR